MYSEQLKTFVMKQINSKIKYIMKKLILLTILITNVMALYAQEEFLTESTILPEQTLYVARINGELIQLENWGYSIPTTLKWTCTKDGNNKAEILVKWTNMLKNTYPLKNVYIWEGKDVKLRKKSKEDGSVYYDIFKGDEWCGGLGGVMMDGILSWELIIKKE